MDHQTGKYIIIAGACILAAGIIIYFFPGSVKWLGRLPGDIRVERGPVRFYFPVVTMLIISIVVTLVIQLLRRIS